MMSDADCTPGHEPRSVAASNPSVIKKHIVFCCSCALQLFNSILLTLPRQTTSSGGKSPAEVVLALAGDIMGKLPVSYNMEAVCASFIHSVTSAVEL